MKSIYVDGYVATKIKEIDFGRDVEVGNIIIPEDAPTPYIAIAASNQAIDYLSMAEKSDVDLNIYLFDKDYAALLTMTETVATKLQYSTGSFEGVEVSNCKLINVVKDWAAGVFGIILTFRIELIEDIGE